ncbi:MAG: SLC13 family permease [Actinomycetota bacterium]|nr:SLC13 family permease [Actinomycetota bacterium]
MAGIAVTIFLAALAAIAFEWVHRTKVALVGAGLMVILGVLDQEHAVEAVDWSTLGLLAGMMILVGLTERTGVFTFLALRVAQLSRGRSFRLVFLLAGVTGLLSAFLDNLTAILLVVPITLLLADPARNLRVAPRDRRDAREQHRRDGDADRRPAEHHDRHPGRGATTRGGGRSHWAPASEAAVERQAPFREAARVLATNEISAIAVVDHERQVVGLFTDDDLLRGIFPGYLTELRHTAFLELDTAALAARLEAAGDDPVERHMREPLTVARETSAAHVAELFLHCPWGRPRRGRRARSVRRNGRSGGVLPRDHAPARLSVTMTG